MPSLSEETNGRIERLMPGATIGVIGGGQLGRMMALSARYMGFRIGVLDPTPDCPTAQVADFQVTAEYDDIAAIRELAEKSDVLTYEFENVDADAIDQVRSLAAAPQGTDLLRVTQDRVNEKRFINDHGTPTAPWKAVNSVEELEAALDEIHYPAVLKTRSGGYDGHGQTVLKSEADLEQVRARADHDGSFPPSILEGFVDFAFEASILVAGNGHVVFLTVHAERGCGRAGQLTTNQTANGGRIQTEARRILAVDLNGNTRGLLACRGLNIDGIRQCADLVCQIVCRLSQLVVVIAGQLNADVRIRGHRHGAAGRNRQFTACNILQVMAQLLR